MAGGSLERHEKDGEPFLTKEPKLLLNNDNAGKPEGIHLMIGRRPRAAFGNSIGDRQMLEWATARQGTHFALLVQHDDVRREYAYERSDPFQTLDVALGEARRKGWTVVSMKDDWNTVFENDRAAG